METAFLRCKIKSASKLLKALANENRLQILCLILNNELSVNQIEQELDISQSALSQHLAILRKDGLVKTRRNAQTIFYSINGDEAKAILSTLHRIYCYGESN